MTERRCENPNLNRFKQMCGKETPGNSEIAEFFANDAIRIHGEIGGPEKIKIFIRGAEADLTCEIMEKNVLALLRDMNAAGMSVPNNFSPLEIRQKMLFRLGNYLSFSASDQQQYRQELSEK